MAADGTAAALEQIESLRFSHEVRLLGEIRRRFGAIPLMDFDASERMLDRRKRDLLGDAVRITEDLLPDVHAVYRTCLKRAGGALLGDLFVQQSPSYNASVFAHDRRFDILVHSALLRDFAPDELHFVFGHELGHVLFRHNAIPVREILAGTEGLPAEAARLLLSWSRAAEISADRIGLLCCGALSAAAGALFKTASGLPGIDTSRVLSSFRRQYDALEKQIHKDADGESWRRTHPMIPIRFKAMELAALDIIALACGSAGFSKRGFQGVDRQISTILSALETVEAA